MRVVWPPDALPVEVEELLAPGDYAKQPKGGFWMVRAPSGELGILTPELHTVIEHEDGTITVEPSLDYKRHWFTGDAFSMLRFERYGDGYHGWLRGGNWVAA